MATWNSRGLRGSTLEEVINLTNEKFRESGLALVTKIPTPIKPVKIDSDGHRITLAYFEEKSTVDYVGVVQGIPLCFDAKNCDADTFAMSNLHEHQLEYMRDFENQGGYAFFLVYFSKHNVYYYLTLREATYHADGREEFKKHIKFDEIDEEYIIPVEKNIYVNYIKILQKEVDYREK
ncbi:MAG: Holliday junction resolvase RecU [Lachnospiraceae bacterium]|nr:Holliday junction resolvase RecU [Lachnospiraceae bacterium]